MKSIFILIGIVAVWYILNRWILPRFGVETWLSGSCDLPVREEDDNEDQNEKPHP